MNNKHGLHGAGQGPAKSVTERDVSVVTRKVTKRLHLRLGRRENIKRGEKKLK